MRWKRTRARSLRSSPCTLSGTVPIPLLEDPWWGLFVFQRGNWREESNQGNALRPMVSVFRECWVGLGVGEKVAHRETEKLPVTPRGNSESRTMRKTGPVLGSPGPKFSSGLGPLARKLVLLFTRILPFPPSVKWGEGGGTV